MKGHHTLKFCLLYLGIVCAATSLHAQCDLEREFENEKFSARPSPANVTEESEDSLKQKGYWLIATVRVKKDIETFWAHKVNEPAPFDDEQQRSVSARGQKDLTPKLLDSAAACGGDLVVLDKNYSVQHEETAKSIPVAWRSESHYETSYSPREHQVKVVTMIPTDYAPKNGTQWYIESRGSVWRLEPGLDKVIAERREKDGILHTVHFRDDPGALKRIRLHAKWGYENESGNTLIQPQFDSAEPFVNGLAMVKLNVAYRYINTTGAFVVKPQFDSAEPFSDGLALVKINGKYGYINTTGAFTVSPKFEHARSFAGGLAVVMVDGKFGYINTTGAIAVTPEFEDASQDISDGLGVVRINGKYGYVDRTRAIVVKPEFAEAMSFFEGLAWVTLDSEDPKKWGCIDKSGRWVIPPKFDTSTKFSEGLAGVGFSEKYQKGTWRSLGRVHWGFINKDGILVIEAKFDDAWFFSEGMAAVKMKNKWGYINKAGEIVIEPQFEDAHPFSKGEATAKLSGRKVIVDKSGQVSEAP